MSSEHYYWLAYDWENLYLLCRTCSTAQGAKFPVTAGRAPVNARGDTLQEEQPELLDPCADDAEQSLVYFETGYVLGSDRRGQLTADIFALNRADLVQQRRMVALEAKELCRDLTRALDQERSEAAWALIDRGLSAKRPFAAVMRQFVNQCVQSRRRQAAAAMEAMGLRLEDYVGALPRVTETARRSLRRTGEGATTRAEHSVRTSVSAQVASSGEHLGLRTVNVSRVRVVNFKGLADVTITLGSGVGRWTMLIGENGVGKTSLLQAVALALSGRRDIVEVGMSPRKFTRSGTDQGRIVIDLDGMAESCSLEFSRTGQLTIRSPFPIAVAAYGSTRLPHTRSAQRTRFRAASIQNLFDPHASLLSTDRWVPDLDLDRQGSVLQSVHSALGLNGADRLYFSKRGNLRLERDGVRLGLEELSSGYQAVGALALDLARIFVDRWASLQSAEGLVLLDEIEAHLHPRWQMKIVRALRTAFPRVQFIVTTHSPLCLRGVRSDEVRVLRGQGGSNLWIDADLPALEGLTADQLLTSEHFGLNTTLDDETQQRFDHYYRLLSAPTVDANDLAELTRIRAEMERERQYGATRRERMMLEVVDEFLAKEGRVATAAEASTLEKEARSKLREIWEAVHA